MRVTAAGQCARTVSYKSPGRLSTDRRKSAVAAGALRGRPPVMYLPQVRQVMAANDGLHHRGPGSRLRARPSTQISTARRGAALWSSVRRGVYADGEYWRSLDEDRGQHRLRTRAAIAADDARLRGQPRLESRTSTSWRSCIATGPATSTSLGRDRPTAWTEYGVKHHLARFRPRPGRRCVDGLEVLDLARTAVDIARELGEPYGEIACDAAMRARRLPSGSCEDACAVMVLLAAHPTHSIAPIAFADLERANLAETLGRHAGARSSGSARSTTAVPGADSRGRPSRMGRHARRLPPVRDRRQDQAARRRRHGGVARGRPRTRCVWAAKKRDRDLGHEGLGTSPHRLGRTAGRRTGPAHSSAAARPSTTTPSRRFGDAAAGAAGPAGPGDPRPARRLTGRAQHVTERSSHCHARYSAHGQ